MSITKQIKLQFVVANIYYVCCPVLWKLHKVNRFSSKSEMLYVDIFMIQYIRTYYIVPVHEEIYYSYSCSGNSGKKNSDKN